MPLDRTSFGSRTPSRTCTRMSNNSSRFDSCSLRFTVESLTLQPSPHAATSVPDGSHQWTAEFPIKSGEKYHGDGTQGETLVCTVLQLLQGLHRGLPCASHRILCRFKSWQLPVCCYSNAVGRRYGHRRACPTIRAGSIPARFTLQCN